MVDIKLIYNFNVMHIKCTWPKFGLCDKKETNNNSNRMIQSRYVTREGKRGLGKCAFFFFFRFFLDPWLQYGEYIMDSDRQGIYTNGSTQTIIIGLV